MAEGFRLLSETVYSGRASASVLPGAMAETMRLPGARMSGLAWPTIVYLLN